MLIEFSELNKHFFNITNIFVEKQISDGKTRFIMHEPRPTDALLLFANTTGVCYQKNMNPIYIPHGALVYMPQNCHYVWENSPIESSNTQENLLFEFTLNDINTTRDNSEKNTLISTKNIGEHISFSKSVSVITTRHSALYKSLMYNLIDAFEKYKDSPLPVYCAAYEMFNTLSNNCRIEQKNNSDIGFIKNSIKYLEDCTLPQKSIKEIAEGCNISISYYERLFKNYAGVSPTEYRHIHRINQIKMFLQEGKISLDEAAEKMGYCDSGYLCRFFKKQTGMTPKEYKRIYHLQTEKSL